MHAYIYIYIYIHSIQYLSTCHTSACTHEPRVVCTCRQAASTRQTGPGSVSKSRRTESIYTTTTTQRGWCM